eukprot:TRINITY_DN5066_c0_g1_i1.p1 TRINITY_DN5066_c0_g1~~TRINITY_DN5066_c0_g1_i1.p1  ORF type:complete len:115 (+),score=8.23 TRINITY_DN5066_c0_g1_i1:540-884(+)
MYFGGLCILYRTKSVQYDRSQFLGKNLCPVAIGKKKKLGSGKKNHDDVNINQHSYEVHYGNSFVSVPKKKLSVNLQIEVVSNDMPFFFGKTSILFQRARRVHVVNLLTTPRTLR